MRVKFLLLLPVGLLLSACKGEDEGAAATDLIDPEPGSYRATLQGYTTKSCEPVLSQPIGVLDASVRIDPPDGGRHDISGSLIWPFGPVRVAPGDPRDMVERLSWTGSADLQATVDACPLRARATFRYFPTDPQHGSLQILQRYAASIPCALQLPCENLAIWQLVKF
jgi:hypothetical protein